MTPPGWLLFGRSRPLEEPSPTPTGLNVDFIPKPLLCLLSGQTHGYRGSPKKLVQALEPGRSSCSRRVPAWLNTPAAGGMEKVPGRAPASETSSAERSIRQHHNDAGRGGDGKNRRSVSAGGARRAGNSAQMVGGSPQLLIIGRKTK